MALGVWQATIVNATGDIQSSASIEVRRESSGALAAIYEDRNGNTPLSNPFTADSNGFARFYVAGGAFQIVATKSGFSRTWRHVPIGTLKERDELFPLTPAEQSAGVTPVNYAYEPGDVRRYGALGDGVTDDTAAIQSALSVGEDVDIPEASVEYLISTPLVLAAAKQCVYGRGQRSKIRQTGANTNSSVFQCVSKGQNEFHDLYVVPGTTTSALADGYGFYISSSSYCVVSNCRVTDHRRGGVGIFDSNHCKVLDNWITDSVVAPGAGVSQSDTGSDIYFGGACSYNVVSGNHCINGSGVGIAFQTLTATDVANHNAILGNIIDGQDLYGIMLYKGFGAVSMDFTLVSGNKVNAITGDIPESGGMYNYGAGIANQSAEHTSIVGNTVRATNTSATPNDLGQVPAAIGASGCDHILIGNNAIEDAGYYGIAVIQSTATAGAGRGAIITQNQVRAVAKTGVYLLDVPSATITGNRLYGSDDAQGIYVRQATIAQADDFIIADNRVAQFTVGVQVGGIVNRAVVHDNIVRGNTAAGITMQSAFVNVHDNTVINGVGGDGISLNTACVAGFCERNYIEGGDYGIVDDGGGLVRVDNNQVSGSTTSFSTSQWFPLDTTATPVVGNKRWVSRSAVLAITNFLGGYHGQVITVQCLASPSNTIKTGGSIQLAGAVDFVMEYGDMLTLINNTGTWQELSRSVN